MAFVTRAERDTSVPAPRSTTDKVGPGSYSLLPARRVIPSVAPFASNTKRSVSEPAQPPVPHSSGSAAESDSSDAQASSLGQRAANPYRSTNSSSFASSTSRFTASKEAAFKPGPGTYQTVPRWRGKHSTTATEHRAEASKKVTALLGPTAGAAAAVALEAVQAATKHGRFDSSKLYDVPVLTPPSIPARHQSYGYEQGPGGLLLMQPPPAAPAAEVQNDTAVQGSQQCSSSSQGPSSGAAKGTAWAASRTDRWQPEKQQQAHRQGQQQHQASAPASCHVDIGTTRFRLSPDGRLIPCRATGHGTYSAAGSAAFVSRVARPHQQEPDPERTTPGPGAYSQQRQLRPQSAPQPAASGFKQAHSSLQQQLFGRVPGRNCAIGGLPGVAQPPSAAPGPGAYDLSSSGALARTLGCSRPTLPPGAAAAARAVGVNVQSDQNTDGSAFSNAAAAGFGSTSSRFDDASSSSPGPGKYTADQVASMAAEVARKAAAASKRGAFGSASCRFTAQASTSGSDGPVAAAIAAAGAAAPSLGPGAYDVDQGVARHVAAAAARPSAGFVSASQRFTPAAAPAASPDYTCWDGEPGSLRGDAARLGPGAYLRLDHWGGKSTKPSSSAGPRISGRHLAYRVAPFGSEGKRNSPTLAAGASSTTPGPGAYNPPVALKEAFRPLSVPGSNMAGFCTGRRRFLDSSIASPGPGTYCADFANSCYLVRPSFNVTLD